MMLRQAVDGYLNFKAGAVLLERSTCKVNQNAALKPHTSTTQIKHTLVIVNNSHVSLRKHADAVRFELIRQPSQDSKNGRVLNFRQSGVDDTYDGASAAV